VKTAVHLENELVEDTPTTPIAEEVPISEEVVIAVVEEAPKPKKNFKLKVKKPSEE